MDVKRLEELRRDVEALPAGKGRRYPDDFRDDIVHVVRAHQYEGYDHRELANKLALPSLTLRRWLTMASVSAAREDVFVPVEVIEPAQERALRVVTPEGFVVEGLELDEPDRTCPSCGERLEPMAVQYESSEMVDVVLVSYKLVDVKRQTYTRRCGGCVDTASGPERAIEGGRYSLAFAVEVAIDKYVDHLPLSRQARIMKRHGLKLSSQTLWDQKWARSQVLRPCYDALYQHALRAPVLGLDQTGWKRLNNKKAKPYQMWCLSTPDITGSATTSRPRRGMHCSATTRASSCAMRCPRTVPKAATSQGRRSPAAGPTC